MPKLSLLVAGQYVAPRLFRWELDYLAARRWRNISLAGIVDRCRTGGSAIENEFSITFDDGYMSVYEHAYPALRDRNLTAAVYMVADAIDGINEWDRRAGDKKEPMMTAQQVKELSEAGFEIGSHSLTHAHLTDLPDDRLRAELVDSKRKIEDLIGKEVVSFSFPYGDYDCRVLEETIAAGYKYALITKLGAVVEGTSLFEIPRVNVRWNALGPLLMRKINRALKASGNLV
jgi:peptidoglycan/xylan/chitin deacetylase (PgdA/CDA1 family)